VVAFAEEASAGRVVPSSVNGKFITRKPDRIDPIEALGTVAGASDAVAALDGFNPPHEGFRRLKAKLAEVRARPAGPTPDPIPEGKTLKPGMVDARVPLLRARFDLPAPSDPLAGEVYDDAVVEAVRAFQAAKGLEDDGIVGRRTISVLNGAAIDQEGEILANMEMWRWMPRDLGTDHVFVNIPEFMARVIRHGRTTHVTRVVVGTAGNQTPVFSDEMEYLVVNPYWHVPESIRMKEMLPEIQADPAGYFRRHGYEAVWNGQVIDPASVIWDENAVKFVAIRQPPSEANALGRIKFMFPNQHAVYMHDTPSRKLFQRDWRAYSHGCVRVDDPMEFARAILEQEPNVSVETLEAMFGGDERRVDLTQHVKVHIAYFTAWVDDDGALQLRDDLYGHTSKVKSAIGHGGGTQ
jgi:murein L,D-transpeptidase YcbB/YkuD